MPYKIAISNNAVAKLVCALEPFPFGMQIGKFKSFLSQWWFEVSQNSETKMKFN